MIEKLQNERGWNFVFLAANQDAFHEAGQIGIHIHLISNFKVDCEGTREAFKEMNYMMTDLRTVKPRKKKTMSKETTDHRS